MSSPKTESSNLKKYNTGNPIVRFLFVRFFGKIKSIIEKNKFKSALEAGCGEGFVINALDEILPKKLIAFDNNKASIDFAKKHCSRGEFLELDIHNLPFDNESFEFTICCEVLEHQEKPEDALNELLRVTSKTLLISVPNEPWFSIGSFCRGKYLLKLGRHPEHIQSWNSKSFIAFIEKHCSVSIKLYRSFPWLIAVLEKSIPAASNDY